MSLSSFSVTRSLLLSRAYLLALSLSDRRHRRRRLGPAPSLSIAGRKVEQRLHHHRRRTLVPRTAKCPLWLNLFKWPLVAPLYNSLPKAEFPQMMALVFEYVQTSNSPDMNVPAEENLKKLISLMSTRGAAVHFLCSKRISGLRKLFKTRKHKLSLRGKFFGWAKEATSATTSVRMTCEVSSVHF